MSVRYLLDTDTCIGVLRRRQPVSQRIRSCSPEDLAVSAMTVAELRFGALNSSDPERTLAAVDALLSAPLEVVAFDDDAAWEHAEARLVVRSRPIGERDLVIAATALAGGFGIITGNVKHFRRVPGLVVEDWNAA